jgi:hypothetical protein
MLDRIRFIRLGNIDLVKKLAANVTDVVQLIV